MPCGLDALEAQQHQYPFNVVERATGWKIAFIIRKFRAFGEDEFRRRGALDLHGILVIVASAMVNFKLAQEWLP